MSMSLHEARTVVDFGLVVLIWIIQLIVYPGFKYAAADTFPAWHSQYSILISFLVIPLMFGQVGLIGTQAFTNPNWAVLLSATLVVLVWASTFFQAVPIHNALQAVNPISADTLHHHASKLVSVNWVRTILWSFIFVLGLIRR